MCYVNNDSFVAEKTFDGMRKHLVQDFDRIYVLDVGGNVRKNPKLSGTTHNVFGIQVGVSINLFIRLPRNGATEPRNAKILYHAVPQDWRRRQKYEFLADAVSIEGVSWRTLKPDAKHNWLTNKTDDDFADFLPLGSKDTKAKRGIGVATVFRTFSLGVSTNRDSVVYDFDSERLAERVEQFADDYNSELERWKKKAAPPPEKQALIKYVDDFVSYARIKWSRNLKRWFRQQQELEYDSTAQRISLYRPLAMRTLTD